jgi:hypothetical protein
MKSTREFHNQMEQQDLKTKNTIEISVPTWEHSAIVVNTARHHANNIRIPGTRLRFLAPIK